MISFIFGFWIIDEFEELLKKNLIALSCWHSAALKCIIEQVFSLMFDRDLIGDYCLRNRRPFFV